jgi:hypothetical protein
MSWSYSIFTGPEIDRFVLMKQSWKQILVWLVVLIIIAATIYYFLTPVGPYLEGFSYSTTVSLGLGRDAIKGLYYIKNNRDLSSNELITAMNDISNICPNTLSTTQMSKQCFDALVAKFNLSKTSLPSSYTTLIPVQAATIIMSVLNRQLGSSYSTLNLEDVSYAMSNDADLSGVCSVSPTGTITAACYNKLLEKFATATSATSTTVSADTNTTNKDRRVELFMAMAETAGYDDIDEEDVRNSYDDMTKTCGKKSVSNDRACYEDIAKDLKIKLFASSSSSPAYDELKNNGNTSLKIAGTSTSNAASLTSPTASDAKKASDAKCTVQFGNDVATPQTKAAAEKPVDKTCGATGDIAKTTKTPAVEQGCEFTQKFPKVNVINLRDYVHKDEVPCWSCKL